ncbi:hypothetical protein C8N29_101252 [Agitococcus lubricus]|uniref:Uncharacterized protein n=1 Tax=Agitococcus lubricus TaxID=1077255 RepID=A0A2T5J3J6_9GAMM|nr:hypothetical protein C8N29_101252 [Agitococcus lubricus]
MCLASNVLTIYLREATPYGIKSTITKELKKTALQGIFVAYFYTTIQSIYI